MQAGILAEVPDADTLTARLAGLADRARAAGRPVFVIQHEAADLVPGEPEWRLAEPIAPHDGDVLLAKRNADSFIGTDLDKRLRDLDVSRARYNQVLSSVDYPDREVSVIPAADITFG